MLALALVQALSGCTAKTKLQTRQLELRASPASPASLIPGSRIEIAAVPVPAGEMQWVSGTVQLFGAPTLAFKKDPKDGFFKFKTMIPPMVQVPAGSYEVKAWGRTTAGEAIEGRLDYQVH